MDVPRISPDGRLLAFDATDMEGKARIWVRPLNSLDGAAAARHRRRRAPVLVAGQPLHRLHRRRRDEEGRRHRRAAHQDLRRAGRLGRHLEPRGRDPLRRHRHRSDLPRAGRRGDARPSPSSRIAAKKETSVGWPQFLPDGKHFIYLVTGEKPEDSVYWIASIDSTEKKKLAPAQTLVEYAPPGYLLFVRDRTLVAQPFDAEARSRSRASPFRSPRRSARTTSGSRASRSRATACSPTAPARPGDGCSGATGRDGSSRRWAIPATTRTRRSRPTGDRLAFNLTDSRTAKTDIWIRDLARGVNSRFTLGAGNNYRSVWSPDGATIVFSLRPRRDHRPLREVDEGRRARRSSCSTPTSPSRRPAGPSDGKYIAYASRNPKTQWDLWALPTFGEQEADSDRRQPLHRDDRRCSRRTGDYVAYVSNESGRDEIYVQTFPERRRQVAGLQRRRHRPELARRREGALLPLARSEADGGRDPRRRRLPGRRSAGALSDPRAAGQPAQQVRAVPGRPAVPHRRAARPRRDVARRRSS